MNRWWGRIMYSQHSYNGILGKLSKKSSSYSAHSSFCPITALFSYSNAHILRAKTPCTEPKSKYAESLQTSINCQSWIKHTDTIQFGIRYAEFATWICWISCFGHELSQVFQQGCWADVGMLPRLTAAYASCWSLKNRCNDVRKSVWQQPEWTTRILGLLCWGGLLSRLYFGRVERMESRSDKSAQSSGKVLPCVCCRFIVAHRFTL